MRLKPLQRALYRSFKSIIIRLASLLDIHGSYHCVRAPIVVSPLLDRGRDLASIRLKLVLVVLLTVVFGDNAIVVRSEEDRLGFSAKRFCLG